MSELPPNPRKPPAVSESVQGQAGRFTATPLPTQAPPARGHLASGHPPFSLSPAWCSDPSPEPVQPPDHPPAPSPQPTWGGFLTVAPLHPGPGALNRAAQSVVQRQERQWPRERARVRMPRACPDWGQNPAGPGRPRSRAPTGLWGTPVPSEGLKEPGTEAKGLCQGTELRPGLERVCCGVIPELPEPPQWEAGKVSSAETDSAQEAVSSVPCPLSPVDTAQPP